MNVDRVEKLLPKGTAIGQLIAVEQTDSGNAGLKDERETREDRKLAKEPETFASRIAPSLALNEREQLLELLLEFQDCFADKGESLGCCKMVEHSIPTGDARPIKQLPRRRAWRERDLIRVEVDEMLNQGVIEPAQSPWSSPVVLVKKKDGGWRFCVDYRRLNDVTTKDVYPLPRIDDALAKLEGATVFSIMDLQSGYWQVPVALEDRPKTAFATPDGPYQF